MEVLLKLFKAAARIIILSINIIWISDLILVKKKIVKKVTNILIFRPQAFLRNVPFISVLPYNNFLQFFFTIFFFKRIRSEIQMILMLGSVT